MNFVTTRVLNLVPRASIQTGAPGEEKKRVPGNDVAMILVALKTGVIEDVHGSVLNPKSVLHNACRAQATFLATCVASDFHSTTKLHFTG